MSNEEGEDDVQFVAEQKKAVIMKKRRPGLKVIAKDGSREAQAQKNKLLFIKKHNPKLFKRLQDAIRLCGEQGITFECLKFKH